MQVCKNMLEYLTQKGHKNQSEDKGDKKQKCKL